MNKSISQIAEDLQVTRQTIYNKLKDAALSAAVKPYTVQQGKYTLYGEQAQNLIKQTICGNSANGDLTACKREFDKVSNDLTECKNELDKVSKELENRDNKILELNAAIDVLKAESETVKGELTKCNNTIADLRRQLSDKDKEISELDKLQEKVKNLMSFNTMHHKTIDGLEQDKKKLNERLDTAENTISNLTTALQAAQALHGIDKAPKTIEVKEEPAADQTEPPRKTSLFSRLFRRNK